MDYQKFYAEVADWIHQSNQMAIQHGMDSEDFWSWVTKSSKELCERYGNNELVIKQMVMLCDWLDGVYERMKKAV